MDSKTEFNILYILFVGSNQWYLLIDEATVSYKLSVPQIVFLGQIWDWTKACFLPYLKLKPWMRKDRWMTGGMGGDVIQFMFVEMGATDHWQNFHWLTAPLSNDGWIQHLDDWVLWGESPVGASRLRPNRRNWKSAPLMCLVLWPFDGDGSSPITFLQSSLSHLKEYSFQVVWTGKLGSKVHQCVTYSRDPQVGLGKHQSKLILFI